jgi:hypothetical protein
MKAILGFLICCSLFSFLSCYPTSNDKNANILGLLGQITNGTSVSNVFTLLNLLNNVHQLQGDMQALPNDLTNAIEHLSSVLNTTVSNLASILTGSNPKSYGIKIKFL